MQLIYADMQIIHINKLHIDINGVHAYIFIRYWQVHNFISCISTVPENYASLLIFCFV